eukprot:TRINITY_DN2781_c0_g1_i1.p2 TRINITY_DN2781_c0_g1~~TRINITY_DN2781_c0_g1_i1.p2  ORF type:complete len:112 (-),score=24.53 TRINITY_DN2781_c0_g1_i1:93-428(-)
MYSALIPEYMGSLAGLQEHFRFPFDLRQVLQRHRAGFELDAGAAHVRFRHELGEVLWSLREKTTLTASSICGAVKIKQQTLLDFCDSFPSLLTRSDEPPFWISLSFQPTAE